MTETILTSWIVERWKYEMKYVGPRSGHGLQSVSDAGEFACSILAGVTWLIRPTKLRPALTAKVCSALAGTPLKKDCTEWLVNSPGSEFFPSYDSVTQCFSLATQNNLEF